MKRIFITEAQLKRALKLKETINMAVDKKPGQDLDAAARDALTQAKKDAPSADINLVVNSEELTEDMDAPNNIVNQVVDFIVKNYSEGIDEMTPVSEIYAMIKDAFFELTGEDVEDEKTEEQVFQTLQRRVLGECRKKTVTFTKKQIKESLKRKRIAKSKVYTKGEILKGLR